MHTAILKISIQKALAVFGSVLLIVAALPFSAVILAGGKGGDPCEDGVPNAYFSIQPSTKGLGALDVTLDGSYSHECSDPIVNYDWDFGDGNNSSGQVVQHSYGVGEFTPSLTITDAAGLTDTLIYYNPVSVKAFNQNPTLSDASATLLHETSIEIDVSANGSDPDGDDITYGYFLADEFGQEVSSLNTDKGYVHRYSSTGIFRYSSSNYNSNSGTGEDSFSVGLRDGYGGVTLATVSVDIIPYIKAIEDQATTMEGQDVVIDVTGNDFFYNNEPHEIYWTWSYTESGGRVVGYDAAAGTVTFRPNADFVGTAQFEYGIKSLVPDTWRVSTTFVYVDVLPVPNHAPVATNDTLQVDEDNAANINILANDYDEDGDAFAATLVSGPQYGSATLADDGTLSYVPNANYFGNDSVLYQITDSEGNVSNEATVAITVQSVNDTPIAQDDSTSISEDNQVTVNVLANDNDIEDGTDMQVSIVGSPNQGSVSVNTDGSIVYTPNANYFGNDSVTYRVTDANGGTATATLLLNIAPVNDLPLANFSWTASNGGRVYFDASASSDVEGIASYSWDFGDGTSVTSPSNSVDHKYKGKSRNYQVALTVTDSNGAIATYAATIRP